jgi:methionyl-tRNA formyltransferase
VLVDVLARLSASGALAATAQPREGVTYAHKLAREDARIDWTRDAMAIDRAVRAFDPWPVAWTTLAGAAIKVWQAHPLPDAPAAGVPPGTVLRAGAQGIDVACGKGVIRLDVVQASNARRMPAAAFVAGRTTAPQTVLGA